MTSETKINTLKVITCDDLPWETLYPSIMSEFWASPENILYTSYDGRTGERIVETTKMKFVWVDEPVPKVLSFTRRESKQ